MKRDIQGILLILVGGAVMRIALTGSYQNYVKTAMKPYLIASAAVLIVLGIFALVDAVRGRSGGHHPATEDDDELVSGELHADVAGEAVHTHDHEKMRTAWLLLLPVAAIFLIAPPPLGAYSASREQAVVQAPTSKANFKPLPAGDPVQVLLNDYAVRAVWDQGRTLTGRNIELIGFVTPDGDGWQLTRMAVACCAADAVVTKVQPVGDVPPLAANTWVSVVGTFDPGGGFDSDSAVPWIKAASVTEIPQPEDPYL